MAYFASKSNATRHKKDAHGQRVLKKTRPLQILRVTAEELLCSVDVNGQTEVLWLAKDTVGMLSIQLYREMNRMFT